MDGLFTGGSSDRRRFLDRLVLSIDPTHGRRASDFERAMKSRNRLLSENRWDTTWLDGLEEQMAGLGVAIMLARREMLGLLARLVEEGAPEVAFPVPALSLAGFMDEDGEGRVAADLEDDYRLALGRDRPRDAAAEAELPINALIARIDVTRMAADDPPNLASAIRCWLFARVRTQDSPQG